MTKPIYVMLTAALAIAAFAGGAWFSRRPLPADTLRGRKILHYVDPMNPAHTSDLPGLAPCGMKMEPVYADEAGTSAPAEGGAVLPGTVKVSTEKQQLIGVQLGTVEKKSLPVSLRMLGRVATDETRIYRLVAAVDGWITHSLPFATGSPVKKDETLATFYSPEFLSAGQALLFALNSRDRAQPPAADNPAVTSRVSQFNINIQQYRDSLHNLGMSETQIEEMIRTRKFTQNVNVVAPADGFVIARNFSDGQRFTKGTELFRIVDLSRVWILAEVFERDARFCQPGATVRVTLPQQHQSFPAMVSHALPQFDATTRTLKLRLEADNPDFALKPDMFVDVEVIAHLPESLVVPASAVLDAGLRKTVFVDRGSGFFEPRVVLTGERSGDQIQILQGLMAGERIVVSGNFLLDSESRMKLAAAGVYGTPTTDLVCGMTVDENKARAAGRFFVHQGKTLFFCNDGCKAEFVASPAKFLPHPDPLPLGEGTARARSNSSNTRSANSNPSDSKSRPAILPLPAGEGRGEGESLEKPADSGPSQPFQKPKDLVCGMTVNEAKARAAGRFYVHQGKPFFFCNDGCKAEFVASPEKFLKPVAAPSPDNETPAHRDQPHH